MRKKWKTISLINLVFLLIAIILMSLPMGIQMKFAYISETGEILYRFKTYAYFNSMVFGNAIITPILTYIAAIITFVVALISFLKKYHWQERLLLVLSVVCFFLSIGHYINGGANITILSICISVLLMLGAILECIQYTHSLKETE